MLRPGDRIDRYVVVGQLGEGALATVFLVRHATLSTLHGLKVVKLQNQEARDRLIKEGQAQASLSHPHIVNVTDVLKVQGAPGILMEYVRGIDLEQLLQEQFLTLDESLALFRGVVCGVGEAHAKGLVHRDLKPANVLLAIQEGRLAPKVADFGLVKAVAGKQDMKGTRAGSTMGTPGYMPPEQIRDASTVDRRADMWALGCLLYRMVCHMPAFPQPDMIALFKAVDAGEMLDPRSHTPNLPDAVVTAIQGLIETDVAARIGSCTELLEVLDGAPRPAPRVALAAAPTTTTPHPTWIDLTSPAAVQAVTMRQKLEAELAANQPAFASLPGETLMPETQRRIGYGMFSLMLLLGLLLVAVGVAGGFGVVGWVLSDGTTASVDDAPPTPPIPVPSGTKRKAKVEARPKPTPDPVPATPIPPKPAPSQPVPVPTTAPEPSPAPVPAPSPVPAAPAPEPEPAPVPTATGPTGEILCKGCVSIQDFYVTDQLGNPLTNGALAAGSYQVWAKSDAGDLMGPLVVALIADDHQVEVRCNGAMGGCRQI